MFFKNGVFMTVQPIKMPESTEKYFFNHFGGGAILDKKMKYHLTEDKVITGTNGELIISIVEDLFFQKLLSCLPILSSFVARSNREYLCSKIGFDQAMSKKRTYTTEELQIAHRRCQVHNHYLAAHVVNLAIKVAFFALSSMHACPFFLAIGIITGTTAFYQTFMGDLNVKHVYQQIVKNQSLIGDYKKSIDNSTYSL
jgi:hypothetical protein